ncbi:lysophospholipid acyltransferase family protein [Lentisphaera profundi]|uniref:Lysophospholipid acyltransferase family protein n=1 Tax=Lentisphaera profundi TaxID=1658616 RepID=A0ABY7W042_9BACT|nr:lysophospholipid acyltransferase family protein [Lentisphaera profundi]WDE97633.1 lysophospholipid acyltransferase family protein [Lentisphaera profundi]
MAKKIKKIRKKIQGPLEIMAIYGLMAVVKCLPLKWARSVGSSLGFMAYQVPSIKKLIHANLDVAFPDMETKESREIAIRSMGGLFNVFIEFLWFKGREKQVEKYIEWDEASMSFFKERRAANKDKKPCILLTMHMGNWEVIGQSHYTIANETLTSVATQIKNNVLEQIMYEGRTATGAKITHEKGAVKALIKSLRDKQTIGLLVDQSTKIKQGGVYAKYFSLDATISRSPATFAKKFDPDVFMVECHRTKKGFYISYNPLPFDYKECGSEEIYSAKLLEYMESIVRKRPDQWIWFYKRWSSYISSEDKDKYPYYSDLDRHAE